MEQNKGILKSDEEFSEVASALRSAFTSRMGFERLLRYHLDVRIAEITGENVTLIRVSEDVLRYTEEQGLTKELLAGARQENPGNSKLKEVASKYLD